MRRLLYLLVVCGVVYAAYRYGYLDSVGIFPKRSSSGPTLAAALDPQTGKPLVKCYRCQGAGFLKCTAPGCVEGWVDCPGHCLKLSVGHWEHLDVAGHAPTELWQKFTYPGGYQAWTTAHVGEVIETRNGKPTNIGKCPVCGGKGKVPCRVCKGTGRKVCDVCGGKKFVPAVAVSAPVTIADETIRLKNGTTIVGKIVIRDNEAVWIRKTDGQTVRIPQKDILQPALSP